jgi:succinate dehydrogenase / fumarate reductase flavoprotein subunit
VPRNPEDRRHPTQIAESERYYFLEERYPTYKNLVPRDIATREIFAICKQGRSVDPHTYCVYLDLTEKATGIPRQVLLHKLGNILEIYEKFVGVDPLDEPMKIFPAVHYSMGGLWVDFEANHDSGGVVLDSPRNHHTNVPGLFAIGEADYQYHGANRLGANSLLSCIFAGLLVGPGIRRWLGNLPHGSADKSPAALFDGAVHRQRDEYKALIARAGDENPYRLHQELGDLMTRNCTVVRDNRELKETVGRLDDFAARWQRCALSDKGDWTNQNLSFTRALGDMIDLAKVIALGALQRDECRGAHYKPEFEIPAPTAHEPAELQRQATQWCERYYQQQRDWLKTTLARHAPNGPQLSYEPVVTHLIPPRPRTYGLRGAELIEKIWRERFQERVRAEFCARPDAPPVAKRELAGAAAH